MRNATSFPSGRRLDVVCLGRFGVDFYAQQIGARLEDVTSFAKYLGGSSANTAFGCARLGLKAGLISRVGNDANGRFLVETIAREGCDTSHVSVDPAAAHRGGRAGHQGQGHVPAHLPARELRRHGDHGRRHRRDLHRAARSALLITGTHFSTDYINRISNLALDRARRNDVRTVLDIDYRPVLWGLTSRGDGETRFIASDGVTAHLQRILPKFDLVIGTIEEFNIAGGSLDIMASLRAVRAVTKATLVVKRGPMGCAVIDGAIPASLDDAFNGEGVEVEVLNVLGAGDAFSVGLPVGLGARRGLRSLRALRERLRCARRVAPRLRARDADAGRARLFHRQRRVDSAAGPGRDADAPASRHGAAHAARGSVRLRVRSSQPVLRPRAARGRRRGAPAGAQAAARRSRGRDGGALASSQGKVGLLCDDRYGQDALNAATGRGWWIGRPVELPGSNPRACSIAAARSAPRCRAGRPSTS